MAPTPTADDFCPAPVFMQSASRTLPATQEFLLDDLERTLRREPGTVQILENTVTVTVRYRDDSEAFKPPIHISVDTAVLGWELLDACLPDRLHLKAFRVADGSQTQQRLVLLLDEHVVGQLFRSEDGKRLKLEIKERRDAQSMGDGLFGCLCYEEPTSAGSAPAGTIH